MSSPTTKRIWDAAVEEKQWRTSLASAELMQDKLGDVSKASSGFSLLCLAELDAGNRLIQAGCFSSRAAFLAEARRLIIAPTTPSRTVASLEAYQACQKQWLEFLIKRYEQDT